jgi:hypothetical protein
MVASDYPHPETIFPDHADTVIAWRETLGEQTMQKLMWENASRFLRLISTPWTEEPVGVLRGAPRVSGVATERPGGSGGLR